jgi:undecaprenyl-diphosphatase
MIAADVLEFIATQDHRLMRCFQRWSAPRWVQLWMLMATRGGDGWAWYTLGIAILIWGGRPRYAAVAAGSLASAAGIVIFRILKKKIGRQRPSCLESHCWASLLPPDQFSFPSGHSITAFAVAVPVALFYPSLSGVLLFCAVSVALSRLVLGMHFLSDVIAGSSIGAALGYCAFWIFS